MKLLEVSEEMRGFHSFYALLVLIKIHRAINFQIFI